MPDAKILVVEDDVFLTKVYQDKFSREGFLTIVASDGAVAFNKAKKEKPDLIILDLLLPKKTGLDVLKELKEDKELKKIPVLILSNLGRGQDIEKGKELGADDYLVKADMTISGIVGKVKKLLGKS
ncbi:response regulator [bacterium (Candidatus Torokbacteria) CG_4_10_14_0_2_um_filter_35_8]|nr:MAG: response regulator [bacterium (Candidatus Torokbacteria) CG_4_10_14_0_2_um_filter_35_8]